MLKFTPPAAEMERGREKTKKFYRNGWRLLKATPVSDTRLDQITGDSAEQLKFPGSATNANYALRTLRRMLHKVEEWKMIGHARRVKMMKEHGRHLRLDGDAERRLLEGAKACAWRRQTFELFRDIVILMRDTGMRNQRELYRARIGSLEQVVALPESYCPARRSRDFPNRDSRGIAAKTAEATSGQVATRYVAETRTVIDATMGTDEKPIQVGKKSFRLLFGGENLEGFTSMRIAQISRSPAGTYVLSPKFIPPLLDIAASDFLMMLARRQVEVLTAKSASLTLPRKQRGRDVAGDYTQYKKAPTFAVG